MSIREILEKQALEDLPSMNIYIAGRKKPKVVQLPGKKRSTLSIGTEAVGKGAMGAAMAGGLPYAVTGYGARGWTPLPWSKKDPLTLEAGIKGGAEKLKAIKIQKAMRGLALGGAIAGAGSVVVPEVYKRLKKQGSDTPPNVGKFVNKSTPKILGAPGESLKRLATDPKRPIKEVLRKQAELDLTVLFASK